jgi:ceramide glucosyltransferase
VSLAVLFLGGLLLCVGVHAAAVFALERQRRGAPPAASPGFAPAVSIVKPLAGLDAELEGNLESFFRQDYPDFEIVFSFASEADAAFAVARRVADRHPGVPSVFVVDGREPGRNAKINRLAAGLRRTRGLYILFSDGDVRVPADFLARTVVAFADPRVGLVSHLFRAVRPASLPARLESLYLDGVLRPATAAFAQILRTPCVVGKSILVSRSALNAIGGLRALSDYLAEDFLLGRLVRQAGYRVALAADEIETISGAKSVSSVWGRHRRWAILRRRLGGVSYAAEALSSPVPFVAGAAVASGGAPSVLAAALGLWAARMGLEAIALRRARPAQGVPDLLLLPLRDLALAALFWAGLLGSRTRWRGRGLIVGPGTLLRTEEKVGVRALVPNEIRSWALRVYFLSSSPTALSPRRASRSIRVCCASRGGSPAAGVRRT